MRSFDKYIPHISVLYLHFGNLDSSSTLILQTANRLPILSNNKTNSIIWYWDRVCIWRWGTIWSHHTVIERSELGINLWIVELLGHDKLFMSNLFSSSVICGYNAFYCSLSTPHTFRVVTNNQNVLFILIIGLWSSALFLGTFTSD